MVLSQISVMAGRLSGCRGVRMKPFALSLCLFSLAFARPASALDERYPAYEPQPDLAGEVTIAAAPAPQSLMILWPEGFRMLQPGVAVIAARGDNAGTVTVRAAVEALAVLVHKDNPLACLPLSALREIYTAENPHWGAAGATGAWAAAPVMRFVREEGSSDNEFFKERVLGGASFAPGAEMVGRASQLLRKLEAAPGGIGYAPAGYRNENLRPLKLSDGADCMAPTMMNAWRADYPLARIVNLRGSAGEPSRSFFAYVLSQAGQHDATIAGHFPLPYVFAAEERKKLGLDRR
ncbi:MAG: substrate-binding domain-containing protein [Parvibaculum sp.]